MGLLVFPAAALTLRRAGPPSTLSLLLPATVPLAFRSALPRSSLLASPIESDGNPIAIGGHRVLIGFAPKDARVNARVRVASMGAAGPAVYSGRLLCIRGSPPPQKRLCLQL
ncbi:MAG: hypothetical protein U1G07_26375 [Verrucomicrobiota bacterium]